MKFSKDYEIIAEEKHYAVFKDGSGVEQKVEIDEKLANELENLQREENSSERYSRMQTFSLDSLNYEGEVFATYDDYQKQMTLEEKVEIVIKQMKPKESELLKMSFFERLTHEKIAEIKHVSRPAITQQIKTAKKDFKKIFEKLFPKTLHFGSFFS